MKQEHVDGMIAVQKRLIYRYDNRYVIDSSDRHPELLAAVVVLDAQDPKTPDVIADLALNHRLAGVRLAGGRAADGSTPWLNSPQALKTWEAANAAGIVVDLEVNGPRGGAPFIPAILALAANYPRVRVVLDHMLEPDMHESRFGLQGEFRQLVQPNIYLKFTTLTLDLCRESDVDASGFLRAAIDTYGTDHVIWGSDVGTTSGTYKDMLDRMLTTAAGLNSAEKRAFFHDNGRRVFLNAITRPAS